jgi:hypothetical protein
MLEFSEATCSAPQLFPVLMCEVPQIFKTIELFAILLLR